MKKVILYIIAIVFSVSFHSVQAQYCGAILPSGPDVCQPDSIHHNPGLYPVSDSLAPFLNGNGNAVAINITNIDTVVYDSQTYTIQSLHIDTIVGLPFGTCWSTNKTHNTLANNEQACIWISGFLFCSPPGQYLVSVFISSVPSFLTFDHSVEFFYLRVNNPGDSITPVDTTQNESNPFESYPFGGIPEICTIGGIENFSSDINSLSIYPNPFSSEAIVAFNSDKAEIVTEKITDMLGHEVYRKNMEVNSGQNSHVIERGSLATGIYCYTISDGKSVYTRRLIVTE